MFYFVVGPVRSLCYPVCHLLVTFIYFCIPSTPLVTALPPRILLVVFPSTLPVPPPLPIPLDTTHPGSPALCTQMCLIFVPPLHEPFGGYKDPPVPIPRIFRCSGSQRGLNSKHQGGVFRRPFGGSKLPQVFDYTSMQKGSTVRQVSASPRQPSYRTVSRLGNFSLLCRATARAKPAAVFVLPFRCSRNVSP